MARPNKRYYDYDILAHDDGSHYDLDEFKEYAALINKALVKNQSTFPDGRVKGTTVAELHRLLGELSIPSWTYDALGNLDHVMQDGVPVRYRVEVRSVKTILPTVFSLRKKKKENEVSK